MHLFSYRPPPRLRIGTYQFVMPFLRRDFFLSSTELTSHIHCMGVTGQGKSKLLAHIATSLILQNRACCVIDPHADLAHDILMMLMDHGYYKRSDAFSNVLYIDFSHKKRFIPFNVLKQLYATDEIARNLVEACTRAWPALADGAAPQFENILLAATVVLIDNKLPLTEMTHVLTNKDFREALLHRVQDPEIVRFFHDRFDMWGRETPQMIESTLRRVFLLSFSPALRFTFGQSENVLDFRKIMDSQVSLIVNLGGLDEQTQRLIGCFLTVGFEQAALSREDIREKDRKNYTLIMDEFSMFSAQSEEALARMLSLARKYRLLVTMAHQTWNQLSERLQGALQNSLPIYFRLGYDDAVWAAPRLGAADPLHVKHEIKPVGGKELGMEYHPVYFHQQEEYEAWTRRIENLWPQEAYVRISRHIPRLLQPFFHRTKTRKIRVISLPSPRVSQERLEQLRDLYAQALLRPIAQQTGQSVAEDRNTASGASYAATEGFAQDIMPIHGGSAKRLLKRAVGLGDSSQPPKQQFVRPTRLRMPKRGGGKQALVLSLDQESRLGGSETARNSGLLSRLQARGHQSLNSRRSSPPGGGANSA